jgi:long-chain acyl-CoA synthetase
MEIKRVFDLLERLQTYAPKKDILNSKVDGEWMHYSVEDFVNHANYVSSSLLVLGLQPGDNVALMAANMPQWNFVDYGAQQVNMPTVPLFPTISNDDLRFVLNHCEAKIIFISEKTAFKKLEEMRDELPNLQHIIALNDIPGARSFNDFIAVGKEHLDTVVIDKIKSTISRNDLFTILYTSGTTGQPKGVMIAHKHLLSNVYICKDIAPFTIQWRALSFLPLNHVYERFLNTLYLYHGVSIYYAESFETIGENCREIKPQVFVAVPRVLERVLEKIISTGEKLKGIKKRIFFWALRIAERFELDRSNGTWYALQHRIADRLVFKKWRAAVGGEVVVIVSGGAALNPRIERVFTSAGLDLLQGYGLTETCVVVAVNRFERKRRHFGTVGLVVENSEVKLDPEDGEILMKGPSLMTGYYKNPDATAEVIDKDGWFHTGDIGAFVDGKYLKITDRKKELFKSSAGKYISPVSIENKLKESKFIEHSMVIGEGQKFASALIVPAIGNFREYCAIHGISLEGNDNIAEHPELKKLIADHIRTVNQSLAPYEQLKRYQLVKGPWSVETGEITPKLSLKRKVITEKNSNTINKIFRSED